MTLSKTGDFKNPDIGGGLFGESFPVFLRYILHKEMEFSPVSPQLGIIGRFPLPDRRRRQIGDTPGFPASSFYACEGHLTSSFLIPENQVKIRISLFLGKQ